jgi:hypothetical protein
MELDDHDEHVVGPGRREGDDRIALLDRQPGEADALLHSNWYCRPRRLLTSRELPGKVRMV